MDIASGIVHSCHRICEAGFSGGSCVCSGDQFVLELISAQEEEDVYEISSKDGKVVLRGNNPVALATAFNQYLKYVCKVHISWLGDHLDLPEKLPLPSETVRNTEVSGLHELLHTELFCCLVELGQMAKGD